MMTFLSIWSYLSSCPEHDILAECFVLRMTSRDDNKSTVSVNVSLERFLVNLLLNSQGFLSSSITIALRNGFAMFMTN